MYVTDSNGQIVQFEGKDGVIHDLEYRYLEYGTDGYVVKIYNENPASVPEGHKIGISFNSNFEVGDEFTNFISVNGVDAEGLITGHSLVVQPESVVFLRRERDSMKQQLDTLYQTVADLVLSM
jgi:hypothetical protein